MVLYYYFSIKEGFIMDIVKNISLLTVSLLTALYGSCIYSTDLTDAAKNGDLELVNALILSGANVDERDADGMTALHVAAWNDHLDIINALIVAGANVNFQSQRHATPLHYAAYKGYMTIAQALIAAGADLNITEINGFTPSQVAHISCIFNNQKMVELLTDYQQRIQDAEQRAHDHIIAHTLALATHERLGAESQLALLDQNLLYYISKFTAEAEDHDARQPRP